MQCYTVEVLTIHNEQEEWWLVRECVHFRVAMSTAREINDSNARVRVRGYNKAQPEFSGYPVELLSAKKLHLYYSELDQQTQSELEQGA